MSSLDSLTAFFYNIIPGSLFVLYLSRYKLALPFLESSASEGFITLIVLIYSLFFGFVFQGATKIARGLIMNRLVFYVITSRRKELFNKAKKLLMPVMSTVDDPQLVFYLMDNYLRANNHANFIAHFTARLAFWSNIFFASLFLSIIYLFVLIFGQPSGNKYDILVLIILDLYSLGLFYEYLRILYESVLQSFVTTLKLPHRA